MNLRLPHLLVCLAGALGALATGCGTTKSQMATEQLLVSDAVDRSVANLDFGALKGQTVYLDTRYIINIKGVGFVNSEYIISSLRQQVAAAGCLMQDTANTAEFIIEARVGALGTNSHAVTYGIPASNALNSAASVVPNAPPLPAIPEIAFAKREDQRGAAKIGVFAYHRDTKEIVWQSGISQSRSEADDTWLLGIGPFQRGTIYKGTRFAGSRLSFSGQNEIKTAEGRVAYDREYFFDADESAPATEPGRVALEPGRSAQQADYQSRLSDEAAPAADSGDN